MMTIMAYDSSIEVVAKARFTVPPENKTTVYGL